MFLRRYGGQMCGSGRKFKSKKSFIRERRLSGETGSCRLQTMGGICLVSFLHVLFLMGKVMEWVWKRESSESLVFCLRLLREQDFIHLHLSQAYWCVVFAVWTQSDSENCRTLLPFSLLRCGFQDWLKADWKLWGVFLIMKERDSNVGYIFWYLCKENISLLFLMLI